MQHFESWILSAALALGCSSSPPPAAPPPAPQGGLPLPPEPATSDSEPAAPKGCACQLKLRSAAAPAAPEAPGSAPPLQPVPPINGDLPSGPFDLERRSACTAAECRLDQWVPDASFLQTTREGVPSQGAVWLETIAERSVLVVPQSTEIDSVALVLEGSVHYGEYSKAPNWVPPPPKLDAWDALRAPGAGYVLVAAGGRATVLMAMVSRKGTLAEAIERSRREKKGAPRPPWAKLETSDLSQVPKLSWGGGANHARIAFGGEGPQRIGASLSLLQASGRGRIPENTHDEEWEHIAILGGSGEMLLGNAKYPVSSGSIFHVPKGTVHGWTGSGQELAAVLIFSPSGPEQRFVKAAKGEPPAAK